MSISFLNRAVNNHQSFSIIAVSLLALLLTGCSQSGKSAAPRDVSEPAPNETTPNETAPNEASSSTFVVNSELDQPDADPGDGICAAKNGQCTVRAAVMEANASVIDEVGRPFEIVLPPGRYELTLPNAVQSQTTDETGSLRLEVPMNVRGAGAELTVIDANQLDRVFEVKANAETTITDLTMTGGAGQLFGGGIHLQSPGNLYRVNITKNTSGGGAGIFAGPDCALDLRDSTISHNIATSQAGGIRIDAWATIQNSTITHNVALGRVPDSPTGGGVPFLVAEGGGIDVRGWSVTITNSTIAYNEASAGGGGLHYATAYTDAAPDAVAANGDPLFEMRLINTIIANNISDDGPNDCLAEVSTSRIRSLGNNIDSDGSCYLNRLNDLPNVDPLLAPMANNGGPTPTHALLPGSPALSAGDLDTCATMDQRGVMRSNDGACDIGAYESKTLSPDPSSDVERTKEFLVYSLLDMPDVNPGDGICAAQDGLCTVRAAVMEANASVVDEQGLPYEIVIPAGYYDLTLPNLVPGVTADATGSLRIEVPMTIRGAGAKLTVIDANQLDRVFEVKTNAETTITDLTMTGGAGQNFGGGIHSQSTVHLYRLLITENNAGGGAGIFTGPDSALDLRDSTVSHNVATSQAGGIRIDQWGTILNSTITHNIAEGRVPNPLTGGGPAFLIAEGGGVDVRGWSATITNSTIAYNEASAGGGGLHFAKAYLDAAPDAANADRDPHIEVLLVNTIIANNISADGPNDCLAEVSSNRIRSLGNNIDSDGSCYLNHPNDRPNVDPLLGPLTENGGPTETHALLLGSPALSAGDFETCSTMDQRERLRGDDGVCDIGAFESAN
jgi:hypothetical protein